MTFIYILYYIIYHCKYIINESINDLNIICIMYKNGLYESATRYNRVVHNITQC